VLWNNYFTTHNGVVYNRSWILRFHECCKKSDLVMCFVNIITSNRRWA
jgi:hypothetical protein